MSIAVAAPKMPEHVQRSEPRTGAEKRIILHGVSWETYDQLVSELDSSGIRLAYDRGFLEIMCPSLLHENLTWLLGRMIEILGEELGVKFVPGRSTTFRRESLARGVEPDECYWVAHAEEMSHKRAFNPDVDPAPDLALEVDLTTDSLNKRAIDASLGVAELWRYDGETLSVLRLQPDGKYAVVEDSPSFPQVPTSELAHFLKRRNEVSEWDWGMEFRRWVRKRRLARSHR
jgi:Uma2 family endonuclease